MRDPAPRQPGGASLSGSRASPRPGVACAPPRALSNVRAPPERAHSLARRAPHPARQTRGGRQRDLFQIRGPSHATAHACTPDLRCGTTLRTRPARRSSVLCPFKTGPINTTPPGSAASILRLLSAGTPAGVPHTLRPSRHHVASARRRLSRRRAPFRRPHHDVAAARPTRRRAHIRRFTPSSSSSSAAFGRAAARGAPSASSRMWAPPPSPPRARGPSAAPRPRR